MKLLMLALSQIFSKVIAPNEKVLGDIKVKKYDGFWGQGSQTAWTP